MKNLIVLLFFFVTLFCFSKGAFILNSDFDVIKKLCTEASTEIKSIIPDSCYGCDIKISGDDNASLVEIFLRENFITSNNEDKILDVFLNSKIIYQKAPDLEERFIRQFDFNFLFKYKYNDKLFTKDLKKIYKDTLDISDMPKISNSKIIVYKEGFDSKGFFEVIFQPLTIIISVGIFVYLLFSIRSN